MLRKLTNVLFSQGFLFAILFIGIITMVINNIFAIPNVTPIAACTNIISATIQTIFSFVQTNANSTPSTHTSGGTIISSPPAPLKPRREIKIPHPRIAVIGFLSILISVHMGFIYPSYIKTACTPAEEWRFWSVFSDKFGKNDIYAENRNDNECIGISDGGFKLDNTGLGDASIMAQAASSYRFMNIDTAQNLWSQAISQSPEDAEPRIYRQDASAKQNANANQYFDILVVTMLSGNSESTTIGQNQLRGFSLALDDYDLSSAGPMSNFPVRFLIANVGSDSQYADQVEQQIKRLAKNDSHLIGILGWPISSSQSIINDIRDLTQTELPIISPTATADELSQNNPYFFRIVPPNKVQAQADVNLVKVAYASKETARPIRIAIFTTQWPDGTPMPYSESLTNDFKDDVQFGKATTIDIIKETTFKHLQGQSVDAAVDAAVNNGANVIYMPGYSQDATIALNYLQQTYPQNPLIIVGGDGLSHVRDYPHSGYPPSASQRLYYTSFTIPNNQCATDTEDFYKNYYQDFKICPGADAMLAYDAANTMFYAMDQVMRTQPNHVVTRDDLWHALKNIDNLHPYTGGITGNIAFLNGDRDTLPLQAFFINSHGLLQPISLPDTTTN